MSKELICLFSSVLVIALRLSVGVTARRWSRKTRVQSLWKIRPAHSPLMSMVN